jgi:hypothetical protein
MRSTFDRRLSAFLTSFRNETVRCPVNTSARMFPDVPVSIALWRDIGDNYITLAEVFAHPGIRGTGAGTEAMRRILDLADKHRVPVLLYPSPMDAGWPRARLIHWYNSFGFDFLVKDAEEREAEQDYTMWREPGAKGSRRPNPRRESEAPVFPALSAVEIARWKWRADRNAREWGVKAGWANGEVDIQRAADFLAWVKTVPTPLRVYRALRLRAPSDLNLDGVGVWWAWDRSGADVYMDDTSPMREAVREGEGRIYVVVGEVASRYVNWGETFFKNLYDAPWEKEIEVEQGAPVRLVAMFPVLDGRDRTDINLLPQPVAARANPYRSRRR